MSYFALEVLDDSCLSMFKRDYELDRAIEKARKIDEMEKAILSTVSKPRDVNELYRIKLDNGEHSKGCRICKRHCRNSNQYDSSADSEKRLNPPLTYLNSNVILRALRAPDFEKKMVVVDGTVFNVCIACSKRGKPYTSLQIAVKKKNHLQQKPQKKIGLADETILTPNFARLIRETRMKMGLTHEQLGMKMNEKAQILKKFETGSLKPDEIFAKVGTLSGDQAVRQCQ